jgi:hypothetical protein
MDAAFIPAADMRTTFAPNASAACSVGLQAAPNGRARQPAHAIPDRPTLQHSARRAPWSPRRRGRTPTNGITATSSARSRRPSTRPPNRSTTPARPPGARCCVANSRARRSLAGCAPLRSTWPGGKTRGHALRYPPVPSANARSCKSPAPATAGSIADSPKDGARFTSSDMNARTPATPSQRNPTATWHPGHNRLAHARSQIRPFPDVTRRSSSRARFCWHAGAPCERSRTVAARPSVRCTYRGDFRLRPVSRSAPGWSARGACAVAVLIRCIASMQARSAMPARPGMTVQAKA